MSIGFEFKRFFVRHDRCAMKVGTDSIMLGSWVDPREASHILDIGSGCGVLSLIMAQKSALDTTIVGIDLDETAVQQARQNAQGSPWSEKLSFEHRDAAVYDGTSACDLIISNPPYYVPKSGVLTAGEAQYIAPLRRQARHTLTLSHQSLLSTVKRNLSPDGRFCCVLPIEYANALVVSAVAYDLVCIRRTNVRSTPRKPTTRALLEFHLTGLAAHPDTLTIHNAGGEYSEAYRHLCQDFYLNF